MWKKLVKKDIKYINDIPFNTLIPITIMKVPGFLYKTMVVQSYEKGTYIFMSLEEYDKIKLEKLSRKESLYTYSIYTMLCFVASKNNARKISSSDQLHSHISAADLLNDKTDTNLKYMISDISKTNSNHIVVEHLNNKLYTVVRISEVNMKYIDPSEDILSHVYIRREFIKNEYYKNIWSRRFSKSLITPLSKLENKIKIL